MACRILVVLALLALPTAQAELALRILEAPQEPVSPDDGEGRIVAEVTLDCVSAFMVTEVLGTIHVQVQANSEDPNVFAQGPGMVELPGCMAPIGSTNATFTYTARASRLAPGLQDIPMNLTAETPAVRTYPGERVGVDFALQVDYFPYIQARVPVATIHPEGGRAVFQVELHNLGNAATTVRIAVARADDAGEPGKFVVPNVTLAAHGGNATVEIEEVGGGGGEHPLRITLTPQAMADPSKTGKPVQVSVFVQGRSIPLPPFLAFAAVLLAVALARRPADT